MEIIEAAFTAFVCLVLLFYIYDLSYNIYVYRLRKYLGGPNTITSLAGPLRWAVVTGGTEGIGLAFAKALAKMNFNIAVTCFSADKLEKARGAILREKPDATVKTIVCDFTDDDRVIRKTMEAKLPPTMDITILVNNAGIGYLWPLDFEKLDPDFITRMIKINCVALTHMCHMFLPRMAKSSHRSILINISSYSATRPTPFLSAYTATKYYIRGLTHSLAGEYNDSNVIIQCLTPAMVATRLTGLIKPSFFVPDPDTFASEALLSVGCLSETPGCFAHFLRKRILDLMPAGLFARRFKRNRRMNMFGGEESTCLSQRTITTKRRAENDHDD